MPLVFEWDAKKAKDNERKHGVSLDEACTVFDDPLAFIFLDEDHSESEPREIIIGIHQCAAGDPAGTERL